MSKTLPFYIKVDVEYPIEIEIDSIGNVGSAAWPGMAELRKAIAQGTARIGSVELPSLKELTKRYLQLVAQGRMASKMDTQSKIASKMAELRRVNAALSAAMAPKVVFWKFVDSADLRQAKKRHPDKAASITAIEEKILSELGKLPTSVVNALVSLGGLAHVGSVSSPGDDWDLQQGIDVLENLLGI